MMLQDLQHHADRIAEKRHLLVPDIRWDGSQQRSVEIQVSETVR